MMPLISVVVPVYNVEKYLNRCIKSLTEQTYRNIEIIIVDDGATDNSGKLCEEWKQKDRRIKVIHKENEGLGLARNTGLEYCHGDYIAFVDSDDFVEVTMFEKMINLLEKNNGDTCYCSHYIYSNSLKGITKEVNIQNDICNGNETLLNILGAEPSCREDFMQEMSVWGALFSADIIKKNKITFKSERKFICEDLPFDIEYLSFAKRVVLSNDHLYYYCMNGESLTHRYIKNRIDKEVFLYKQMLILMAQYSDLKTDEYLLRYNKLFLGRVRACIVQEVTLSQYKIKTIRKNISMIVNNALVRKVISTYPIQNTPFQQKLFNMFLKKQFVSGLYLLAWLKQWVK